MEQNRELKTYYKNIKQGLPCGFFEKIVLVKELKNNVKDYLIDNPNANIDDIMSTFGSFKEIEKSYNNNPDFYKKKIRNTKIALALILIISILFICLLSYCIVDTLSVVNGHTEIIFTSKRT